MASRLMLSLAVCAVASASGPSLALGQLHAGRGTSFGDCWPFAALDGGCVTVGAGLQPMPEGLLTTRRSPWNVPELPSSNPAARRATFPIETGWVRVVPTVVYVPDASAQVPGVVSIGLERAAVGDPVSAKAELGWSGKPGASFEVDYRVAERQMSFKAEERPDGVVALPQSRAPGSTWDGKWTERIGARTTASFSVSGDRLDLRGRDPGAASTRFTVRHRAADGWNLFGSMSGTSYAETAGPELRRSVASVGTELRAGTIGVEAVYRDESSPSVSGAGHGGRVVLRANQGAWHASVYADAQQQASTLQLDTAGRPEVPLQFEEVGLLGGNPEQVVQVLRDRGHVLAQHGVEPGALRLDPLRVQGGLDIKWREAGARGAEVGLRLAMDDLQGSDVPRRALLGQLQMSWRVLRETQLTASYASWTQQGDSSYDDNRTLFRLLVRSRL